MTKIILLLAVAVAVAIFGPLLTIWSLNTLFPSLAIPFNLDTWAAIVLLGIAIRGDGLSFGSKK
jgi:hypothetical protein